MSLVVLPSVTRGVQRTIGVGLYTYRVSNSHHFVTMTQKPPLSRPRLVVDVSPELLLLLDDAAASLGVSRGHLVVSLLVERLPELIRQGREFESLARAAEARHKRGSRQ